MSNSQATIAAGSAGHQGLEGFLTAKLVTEALQRAGRQPTPADHSGGKFVEMSIIDERGEFLQ